MSKPAEDFVRTLINKWWGVDGTQKPLTETPRRNVRFPVPSLPVLKRDVTVLPGDLLADVADVTDEDDDTTDADVITDP